MFVIPGRAEREPGIQYALQPSSGFRRPRPRNASPGPLLRGVVELLVDLKAVEIGIC
jgi:hypothetical protein